MQLFEGLKFCPVKGTFLEKIPTNGKALDYTA